MLAENETESENVLCGSHEQGPKAELIEEKDDVWRNEARAMDGNKLKNDDVLKENHI